MLISKSAFLFHALGRPIDRVLLLKVMECRSPPESENPTCSYVVLPRDAVDRHPSFVMLQTIRGSLAYHLSAFRSILKVLDHAEFTSRG